MPTVARFNITPVKSTSLQHPDTIELGPNGVAADRRFLFIGAEGKRISGGSKAALLGIRSSFDPDGDRLTLELPDGTRAEGGAMPAGDGMRVALFDREVDVRPVPDFMRHLSRSGISVIQGSAKEVKKDVETLEAWLALS